MPKFAGLSGAQIVRALERLGLVLVIQSEITLAQLIFSSAQRHV